MRTPTDRTMSLADAKALAGRFIELIVPSCERVLVVGSVRRKRGTVHDVDIVAIPRRQHRDIQEWFSVRRVDVNVLAERINELLHGGKILPRVKKDGKTMVGEGVAFVEFEGWPVDLYYATPETWGGLVQVRTGSAEFNRMLATKALSMGMMFHADGTGITKDGVRIDDGTEPGIFAVFGMHYYKPEDREIPFTG